jgi:MFS family permease
VEMVLVYKLENRYNHMNYIIVGAFFMGTSFLSLNIPGFLGVALLSVLILTLGEMFLFPFMNTFWVARSKEHNRGEYAAVYAMSFSLAQVVAPTVASQLALHYGFKLLFVVDFSMCCLAATGFYVLSKNKAKYESIQAGYTNKMV